MSWNKGDWCGLMVAMVTLAGGDHVELLLGRGGAVSDTLIVVDQVEG